MKKQQETMFIKSQT
jgi:hypothetical protein